jgi:hypothetical protein
MASDYCYDIEVKRAIERHNAGEACVIPIILRKVDWHTSPLDKLLPIANQWLHGHPVMMHLYAEVSDKSLLI